MLVLYLNEQYVFSVCDFHCSYLMVRLDTLIHLMGSSANPAPMQRARKSLAHSAN